jgi:hypothetical protein
MMKEINHFSHNSDFICVHCQNLVSAGYVVAGVNNRNHCPYCLWSRHLDWRRAGDRLSACKGSMQPIGLTVKKTRQKYGLRSQGELMLIHRCLECGKIAINRIAADDDSQRVVGIFDNSVRLKPAVRQSLADSGVRVLLPQDKPVVEAQLFGWSESLTAIAT